MADSAYAAWSLPDLKAAAAAAKPAGLERDVTSFADGESAMIGIRERFDAALAALSDSWPGTAAQAAGTNARAAIATLTDTSQTAAATSGAVVGYAQSVRDAQQAVAAIPDKSFDWGEAFTAGSFAGPIGIGGDALKQAVEAEQHRKHAAELVEQMDHAGRAHADVMKGMPWTSRGGSFDAPAALTPPPAEANSEKATAPRAQSHSSSSASPAPRARTPEGDGADSPERAEANSDRDEVANMRLERPRSVTDTTSVTGGIDLPAPHAPADVVANSPRSATSVAAPSAAATAALGGVGMAAGGLARTASSGAEAAGRLIVASSGRPVSSTPTGDRPNTGRGGAAERAGARVESEPRATTSTRTPPPELGLRERAAPPTG